MTHGPYQARIPCFDDVWYQRARDTYQKFCHNSWERETIRQTRSGLGFETGKLTEMDQSWSSAGRALSFQPSNRTRNQKALLRPGATRLPVYSAPETQIHGCFCALGIVLAFDEARLVGMTDRLGAREIVMGER